jgi:hypothetical protein
MAPGECIPMEIVFNPVRLRGPMWRLPEITTNGEPEKKLLKISANVTTERSRMKVPIVFEPFRLDLPQYGDEIIDTARFEIKNISKQDVNITLIDIPKEIRVELPGFIKAGASRAGIIRLKESARDKNFWKSITIEVDDEKHSRFTIPVEKSPRLPE